MDENINKSEINSDTSTEKEKIRIFDEAELPVGELAPPPECPAVPRRYISWQRILFEGVRTVAAVAAFAVIFYMLSSSRRADPTGTEPALSAAVAPVTVAPPETQPPDETEDGGTDSTDATGGEPADTGTPEALLVLNESGIEVDIPEIAAGEYILGPLAASAGDIRVIIIHSHTSERVSENEGVAAAGEKLAAMLNSAGIPTYHCAERQDKNGVIGAYSVMSDTLDGLLGQYPDTVCVIDLHCSDTSSPLTLTVGCSSFTGWRENLLLAVAVCREAGDVLPCLRLMSGTLGQDSGVLSLHAGICGGGYTAQESSAALDALYRAIVTVAGLD